MEQFLCPEDLIDAVKSEKLVLFAGAGISKSVGLPLWDELIEKIIKKIRNNSVKEVRILQEIWEARDRSIRIFDVLEMIQKYKLTEFVDSTIHEEIYRKGDALIKSEHPLVLHEKLWHLSSKIITSNYDNLFEACHKFKEMQIKATLNCSIQALPEIQQQSSYLLKIHGSIDSLDSMIFYKSQYQTQYETDSLVKEVLRRLINDHTFLFVGTSMTDPYINEIIHTVYSLSRHTRPINYILTDRDFTTADVVKIPGDPIRDLDKFLETLLSYKSDNNHLSCPTMSNKRMKTVREAIEQLSALSSLFPQYSKFESNSIKIDEPIFQYVSKRFANGEGPVLFEGRWSTGKTVNALRIGIEFNHQGYETYYLDLCMNDFASDEQNILPTYLKLLKNNAAPKKIFILDNVHLFPEISYEIATWSIAKKANCIFIGRPIAHIFSVRSKCYPQLFAHTEHANIENDIDDSVSGSIIYFEPNFTILREIFENKLSKYGRSNEIAEGELKTFAEYTGYNLQFAQFHVNYLPANCKNIFTISYDKLYDYINATYQMETFRQEIFTIAALCYIDCRIHCSAIFPVEERKKLFLSRQNTIVERRNYLYGLESAEARMIIEVGYRFGFIRTKENDICGDFHSSFKALVEKYLLLHPANIYDVFIGLVNFEVEARMTNASHLEEEIREFIYYLLTEEKFAAFYSERIINATYIINKFGFLIKIYRFHNIGFDILNKVINEATIIELVHAHMEYKKTRWKSNFYIDWRYKYTWSALNNVDTRLAETFINCIPKEKIIQFAGYSISGLQATLEIAYYHNSIKKILSENLITILGSNEEFLDKFNKSGETSIYFCFYHAYRLINSTQGGENFHHAILSKLSPDFYTNYVKNRNQISPILFIVASQYLGKAYLDNLLSAFKPDFIYRLFYDRPLNKIKYFLSASLWKRFINEDLKRKIQTSSIDEINTFIRNLLLHGFPDYCRKGVLARLSQNEFINIIQKNVTDDTDAEVIALLGWLNSLNNQLFNNCFEYYYLLKGKNILPETGGNIKLSFTKIFLIHCYVKNINLNEIVHDDWIKTQYRNVIVSHAENQKIYYSAIIVLLNLNASVNFTPTSSRIKIIQFVESLFMKAEEDAVLHQLSEKNRKWWEGKILTRSLLLLGVNCLDQTIIHESRFNESVNRHVNVVKPLLNMLEEELLSNNSPEDKFSIHNVKNKISILKKLLDILDTATISMPD